MIPKLRSWGLRPAAKTGAPEKKPNEMSWEEKEPLFASHVPVLVGLARIFTVRRVLELGAGLYSTPTFLDRRAFGDLKVLHSAEDDPVWAAELVGILDRDPRAVLLSVPAPARATLDWIRVPFYDLVFVDNSTLLAERAATIRRVQGQCGDSTAVVMHDYEHDAYRDAAAGFENTFAFTALTPNTGVAWNGAPVDSSRLEELDALIAAHKGRVRPQDVAGWLYTMDTLFQPLR